MPKIESLKCPNCGAAIRGTGQMVCPYCGSQLRVEGPRAAYAEAFEAVETEGYFNALPGVPITRETRELPFKPEVVYGNLPGGRLDPALANDADRIVSLVEKCQRAVNAEDLELYMSTISKEAASFYEMAREGARAQFIESDMKRYTTRVDFQSLTPESAEVAVSFEAFIFPSTGPARAGASVLTTTQHMEVTFTWLLRKAAGRWKVVGAGLRVPGLGVGRVQRWVLFISLGLPLVGLLIGLVAACWAIFGGFFIAAYEGARRGTGEEPRTLEVPITEEGRLEERSFVAGEPITAYEDRDAAGHVEYVITPGTEFEVKKDKEGWSWVWVDGEGFVGWVPSAEINEKGKEVVSAEETETAAGDFVVETALVIYEKPDFGGSPKYVIMPGARVNVEKREGDWAYVRTDDGQSGWTPAMLLPE